MQAIDIQGFTFEEKQGLLPLLASVLRQCGGWIVENRALSPTNTEFQLEIPVTAALDIYSSILAAGVELTRAGHEALTELCTLRKHLLLTSEPGQQVMLRLEISFREDVCLPEWLSGGFGLA